MREFKVTVRGEVFNVLAKSHNKALYDGVKLYREKHKGYTFAYLVSIASAKLVSPKPSGRPPMMNWRDLDFRGFKD